MIHNNEIQGFNLENISRLLNENPTQFFQILEKFSERHITVTKIDSRLDRKLLYAWKKNGLIPFSQENKKWNRFSFLETCWFKILLEFRELGVSIEKLVLLKESFFGESFATTFFENAIKKIENNEITITSEITQSQFAELVKSDRFFALMREMQFSLFSLYLYSIILTRGNLSLVITGKGKIETIDLNSILNDSIAELPTFYKFLSENTIAAVNVRKIIVDLSGTHKYFKDTELQAQISQNSVDVIRNLFLENQVKEVTIRISEKGELKVALKSWVDLADFQKEIYKLRKKGQFEDVMIKTRDGNIQYFEKTELLKL